MSAQSVKIFICNKVQYFQALPVLILEMWKCLFWGNKKRPYPGSKDLILDPSLPLYLLTPRHASLAWRILLVVCLRFWQSASSLDVQTDFFSCAFMIRNKSTPYTEGYFEFLFAGWQNNLQKSLIAAAAAVGVFVSQKGTRGHRGRWKEPGNAGGWEWGTLSSSYLPLL